jgi:hypothetical protein
MPKKSLRSQQAKAQRASGKRGFDTGYTDNPFEKLFDPDFEPDLSAREEEVDSDCNASPCGYTFSMVDEMSGEDDMDVNETKICMILFSRIDFFMLTMFITIGYCCLGDGTFKIARQLVPELLNTCEVKTIRAFYRKAWRYMDAYE